VANFNHVVLAGIVGSCIQHCKTTDELLFTLDVEEVGERRVGVDCVWMGQHPEIVEGAKVILHGKLHDGWEVSVTVLQVL